MVSGAFCTGGHLLSVLYSVFRSTVFALSATLIYDTLAFFPQFLIGGFAEKQPRFPLGITGAAMVLTGALSAFTACIPLRFTGLLLLSVGNACVHVSGAAATLYTCRDKISPSAVFIAGGAFGVFAGTLLGSFGYSVLIGICAMLFGAVLMLFSARILNQIGRKAPLLHMADPRRSSVTVILLAFFVVSVRGLLAYGIPTGWNRSWKHTAALFCMMGLGKAAGGFCSDFLGARKTAVLSTICAVPLLLLGDANMWVSLTGIMLFSMTMASTLGIVVSASPKHPVGAYGITVLGLFVGSVPALIPAVHRFVSSGWVLGILSLLCCAALWYIMAPDTPVTQYERSRK